MPKRTFITKSSAKVRGRKEIKERFTVLFTTNATGSCRMKLTVIHRAKKPRAYKRQDMTRLNVNWLTSKKAWMSGKLSVDWFNNFFVPEVRAFCEAQNICFNILLLLDNAPGHSPLLRSAHPNIRVEFLPPNTTSLIQPMDMEIVSCVKAAYSCKQFRRMRFATEDENAVQMLVDSEEGEDQEEEEGGGDVETEAEQQVKQYWRAFNVKEAIDLMVECWDAVTPATVNHARRNVLRGFA
ncbi:tigger transposable element-derived protein 1-like [Homarus americanus]|uniref:tigger transposable element-derived protein 1-like n=1 Tax=Homarus americanus TaxID=6706 RepID=UPI001C4655C6|nr:tigger transposable element-derived protein 1-like [Homarus americanus]